MTQVQVSIAMATYEGARFLPEQLDSLAAQVRLPDELVVCDDGSTDDTVDILERFARRAPFPVRIHRNEANLGYVRNFLKAASLCAGDWIALCDQDDVWSAGKLEEVVRRIEAVNDVVLVVHSAEVADGALERTKRVLPRLPRRDIIEPLAQPLWFKVPGFCCTFRADLVRDIPFDHLPSGFFSATREQSVDKRIVWLANVLGRTAVIHRPLALYRRHDANVSVLPPDQGWMIVPRTEMAGFDQLRASITAEYAAELQRLAGLVQAAGLRQRLTEGSRHYDRLADGYRLRCRLHGHGPLWRLKAFGRLLSGGFYRGPRSFGARGALRDLSLAISLPAVTKAATGSEQ